MTFDDRFGIALYLLGGCVTVLISDPYFRRASAEKSEKNLAGATEVILLMLTATLWPIIVAYVVGGWFGQKMNETDAADADDDDDDDHGGGLSS